MQDLQHKFCNMSGIATDSHSDSVQFLASRVDKTFLDVPKAAVVQGGYDFDEWQFWKKESPHGSPSHEKLSNPEAFTWAGDVATLQQTLFAEGVVLLGTMSEEWLQQLECFCASNKFDNVLSLGCERREDGYAACGEVLSGPWASWMTALKHSYGYASVITAFPTDGDDQGWHRDTPDDLESEDHQVRVIQSDSCQSCDFITVAHHPRSYP